jgi:hypothetical protein
VRARTHASRAPRVVVVVVVGDATIARRAPSVDVDGVPTRGADARRRRASTRTALALALA